MKVALALLGFIGIAAIVLYIKRLQDEVAAHTKRGDMYRDIAKRLDERVAELTSGNDPLAPGAPHTA